MHSYGMVEFNEIEARLVKQKNDTSFIISFGIYPPKSLP